MAFKICMNLGTLGHLDYEKQLRVSRQAGILAVGLHMIRLEEYLYSGHTLDDAAECLKKNQLKAAEVVFMPDWISAKDKSQKQIMARAEYICSTMELLECPILIANTLGEKQYDQALVRENFGELCKVASKYGVRIAIEYLPWTSMDTLGKAWDIVRTVNPANGGIVLDTFHYFKGRPSTEELYEVPIEKIFIVHLDDVEDVETDLITLTRKHRLPPGEGIFAFDEVLEYLFTKRYEGYYSLEILNKNHPLRDPVELATRARFSTEKLLVDYERRFEKRSLTLLNPDRKSEGGIAQNRVTQSPGGLKMKKATASEKVRLGLIGFGLIGTPHARTLKNLDACDLVAISDIDETLKEAAELTGAKFYRHYEEMIEKESLQGVVIAVPNHLHVPIGITCARKGLHLFVEKPVAPSVSEADRLIEAARKSKVRILVGHQRRFNPLVEKAREIVRGGGLGKLVGVAVTWALLKPSPYFEGPLSWRREKGGGPILINLIHDIDNMRYICGEVNQVYAMVSHQVRSFPVEDTASITLRFENGALGTIFLSDCAPSLSAYEATTGETPYIYGTDTGNCYHFFGTEASLAFPRMKRLFYSDPAKSAWNYPLSEEEIAVVRGEDPYTREFRHFCGVILGKETPRTSGEDGRKTLEVTLAAGKSAETGRSIALTQK